MKKFFFIVLLAGLLSVIFLVWRNKLIIKVKALENISVAITEIMYNPQGSDEGREWIEVHNFSTSTAYLLNADWRFNDGSNHRLALSAGTSTLASGEYAVIASDDQAFLQDYPDFSGNLFDSAMALNNAADSLSLSLDNGQSFFANVDYDSDWGGTDNGYTLEFAENGWRQAEALGGTPGRANLQAENQDVEDEENNEEAGGGSPDDAEENPTTTEEVLQQENNEQGNNQQDNEEENIEDIQNNERNNENENLNANNNLPAVYSEQIVINEILPDPKGPDSNDEFIELYNRSADDVDLHGWILGDASSKRYLISRQNYPSTIIPAFGYFIVYGKESKISLNNTGDSAKLFQPNNNLLDQISYGRAEIGYSFMKDGGAWLWTALPTPGKLNILEEIIQNDPEIAVPSQAPLQTSSIAAKKISYNPDLFAGLRINEIFPNPEGPDSGEWVELFNNSSSTLDLLGFALDDAQGGSKPYVFNAGAAISAYGYLLVEKAESKTTLNNESDASRLLDPGGEIIFSVEYEKTIQGQSYNFEPAEEEWFWSKQITPNQVNVQPFLSSIGTQTNNDVWGPSKQNSEEIVYPPQEIKFLGKGEQIKTRGIVIAALGQVNGRAIYLADAKEKISLFEAVQVYSTNASLLKNFIAGDTVEFSGYVSIAGGLKRLNLDKESSIVKLGHHALPEPPVMNIGDLTDDYVNGLIKIKGLITEKKGDYFYLSDDTGEVRVALKSFKPPGSIKEGGTVEATGILSMLNGEWRLIARAEADISSGTILGASENIASTTIDLSLEQKENAIIKYLSKIGEKIADFGRKVFWQIKKMSKIKPTPNAQKG